MARGVPVKNSIDAGDGRRAIAGTRYNFNPVPVGQASFVTVSLFNNDNLSRDLIVYGFSSQDDGGFWSSFDYFNGQTGGFVQNAVPYRPMDPVPPGQVLVKQTLIPTPTFSNNPDITNALGTIPSGFNQGFNPSLDAPLWIIPQGFSLRFGREASSTFGGVTWWYLFE